MNFHRYTRPLAFAIAALLAPVAHAAAPVGSASAWDLSIDVSLIGLANLSVGVQASAQLDSVVTPGEDSMQLPSLNVAAPLNLITLSTGLLESSAEYVGGGDGMSAIAARSAVENLGLGAGVIAPGAILDLSAGLIASQTALAGTCPDPEPGAPSLQGMLDDFVFYNSFDSGNLIGGGGDGGDGGEGGGFGGLPPTNSTLVDPRIRILGIEVPGLPLNPEPNTSIDLNLLGIAGASLILNEQTRSGDGVHSLSSATNALHLTLNVIGVITADVIIAHSEASLVCP